KVRIKGERLTVDTSGSAPQQRGPVNAPYAATVSFARLALKRLLTPNMDANEGCFRFLEVVAPIGSIFNPKPPAPVFQYHTGPVLMGELLMKALAPVLPTRAVAREGGYENAILFSGLDLRRGSYVAGADVEGVGVGASYDEDGESALIAYYGGDCHNLPVEV